MLGGVEEGFEVGDAGEGVGAGWGGWDAEVGEEGGKGGDVDVCLGGEGGEGRELGDWVDGAATPDVGGVGGRGHIRDAGVVEGGLEVQEIDCKL